MGVGVVVSDIGSYSLASSLETDVITLEVLSLGLVVVECCFGVAAFTVLSHPRVLIFWGEACCLQGKVKVVEICHHYENDDCIHDGDDALPFLLRPSAANHC